MAMMAITTSNSINVKAERRCMVKLFVREIPRAASSGARARGRNGATLPGTLVHSTIGLRSEGLGPRRRVEWTLRELDGFDAGRRYPAGERQTRLPEARRRR